MFLGRPAADQVHRRLDAFAQIEWLRLDDDGQDNALAQPELRRVLWLAGEADEALLQSLLHGTDDLGSIQHGELTD